MRIATGVGIRKKTPSGGVYAKSPTSGILVPKSGHVFVTVTEVFDTPGSNFWQAPVGIRNNQVTAQCIAGGGGGGGTNSFSGGGGGGAGGAYAEGLVPVTPTNNYSVQVGDFGSGGGFESDGNDGGDSFFDGEAPGTVHSTFGFGGTAPTEFAAGTGGLVNDPSSGIIVRNGGTGGDGSGVPGTGGGGGGAAGTSAAGGNASGGTHGAGGASFGGDGADGNAGEGGGGNLYGGAGAGSGGDGSNGGDGNSGLVRLTYQV